MATTDGDRSIDPERLRKFDRNLIEAGGRLAHRVVEPTPLCWFCDSATGARAKEHIFPQWLLKHYGAMNERVHPVRISMALGGVLASERAERPLSAHVNGEVCAGCNNGWMSLLEESTTPILTKDPRRGPITEDEARILARWFAKTAVNLNVSQPYRLLVNAQSRQALATGIPDKFAVHLFRVRKQNGVIDWAQKSPDMATGATDELEETYRLLELTLVAHIRVADLAAIVVHVPEGLKPTDVTPEQTTRIHPLPAQLPSWETLPIHDDYLGPVTHLDIP